MNNKTISYSLWYKEPWVWFIILMIFFTVLFSLVIFFISLHISNDLVYDNYYKEGKNIFKEINKENTAKKLNISAKLFIEKDMRTINLVIQGDYNKNNTKLKLEFIHPFLKSVDKQIILTRSNDNVKLYIGILNVELPFFVNHWYIHLGDIDGNWLIRGKWIVNNGNAVLLEPVLERYVM